MNRRDVRRRRTTLEEEEEEEVCSIICCSSSSEWQQCRDTGKQRPKEPRTSGAKTEEVEEETEQ